MWSNVSAGSMMILIITNKPIASNIAWNQNRENPPRFTLMFFCFFLLRCEANRFFYIDQTLGGCNRFLDDSVP